MTKEQLIFPASDSTIMCITIIYNKEVEKEFAIFNVDTNTMVLGKYKWMHWQDISGNSNKQKEFFDKVRKVSNKILG